MRGQIWALALAVAMAAGCASGGTAGDEIDASTTPGAIDAGIDAMSGAGFGEDH